MKKTLIILGIVFSGLFLFSGCGAEDTFKDEAELIALTGIITEQTNGDEYGGTHILTDDVGEITALRSLSIMLSNVQYLGNKVKVLGFMNDDEVFEITGISVLEVLSEVESKRKFIDYRNTEFGLRLKYYNDWKVEEGNAEVVFQAPSETGEVDIDKISISHAPFSYSPTSFEDGTIDTPLSAYFTENADLFPGIEDLDSMMNKVGVDRIDSVKLEDGDGGINYYLYRSGLIYKISFLPSITKPVAENKKTFFEMLLEFRFIGFDVEDEEAVVDGIDNDLSELPSIDMELTSFESLPYSFSGKYPASWYYAGSKSSDIGVLHHYGFSTEAVTDSNEILSLDIISGPLPSGEQMSAAGKKLIVVESAGTYTIFSSVNGQNYKIGGPKEHENLIFVMAASVTSSKEEIL